MSRILSIIVTYNRLDELKQCIKAQRNQTYNNFDICIVNNGSTDGTTYWLQENNDGPIVINQENLGGAGGFYAGQKYAVENGYDWVWMMDDDGVPHPEQLKNLIAYSEKSGSKFINALVLDKEDYSRFAFHAYDWTIDKAKSVKTIDEFIHPFNGTFIHTDVLKKAGLVKKEMFIWGDEIELTLRYTKAGHKPVTVTNAIHFHPKEKGVSDVVLPGIITSKVLVKPKKLSKYYYRNLGYINQTYFREAWFRGLKPMIWYAIYYCRKRDFAEAYKAVKYYIRGLHKNFND